MTALARLDLIAQIHAADPALSLAHLHSRFDFELAALQYALSPQPRNPP